MKFGVQDIEGGDFTLFREGEEGMKQGDEAALVFGEEVLKDRVFCEVYGPEGGGCLLLVGVCPFVRGCFFVVCFCHGFFHGGFLLMGGGLFLPFPHAKSDPFFGKKGKKVRFFKKNFQKCLKMGFLRGFGAFFLVSEKPWLGGFEDSVLGTKKIKGFFFGG